MESSLSSRPPWPGMIRPESLTSAMRLSRDSTRVAKLADDAERPSQQRRLPPRGRQPQNRVQRQARGHGAQQPARRALAGLGGADGRRERRPSNSPAHEIGARVGGEGGQQQQQYPLAPRIRRAQKRAVEEKTADEQRRCERRQQPRGAVLWHPTSQQPRQRERRQQQRHRMGQRGRQGVGLEQHRGRSERA